MSDDSTNPFAPPASETLLDSQAELSVDGDIEIGAELYARGMNAHRGYARIFIRILAFIAGVPLILIGAMMIIANEEYLGGSLAIAMGTLMVVWAIFATQFLKNRFQRQLRGMSRLQETVQFRLNEEHFQIVTDMEDMRLKWAGLSHWKDAGDVIRASFFRCDDAAVLDSADLSQSKFLLRASDR